MSFKAVLWDFGGVITESPFKAINALESKKNLPLNTVVKINSINPNTNAWALLEKGDINIRTFNKLFKEEALKIGIKNIDGIDVLKCLYGKVRPRMLHALKCIKTNYKCACLTNNIAGIENYLPDTNQNKIKETLKLFDFVIESRLEKTRKPEKKIYELAIKRFAVEANEIIFLDDLGINLKPARKLGFTTIKVKKIDNTIKVLEKLLNLSII